MNPKRKQRLYMVLFVLFGSGIVIGLATVALRENINLFYTPSQIALGEAPVAQRIRAGGMVEDGSVTRDDQSLNVRFGLTDFSSTVTVSYTGILPDLFREGQGIVVNGRMDEEGVFQAQEVLAKHDENYMSTEVRAALEAAGKTPEEINKAKYSQ